MKKELNGLKTYKMKDISEKIKEILEKYYDREDMEKRQWNWNDYFDFIISDITALINDNYVPKDEAYSEEFITWLFKENVWTDCTGLEPITQIEINDVVCSVAEAFEYWKTEIRDK